MRGIPCAAASRRLVAGVTLWVAALAPAHGEQRGRVFFLVNPQAPREEWQRRPLPGAFVALSWTILIPGPGHAVDKCVYSELARTDELGEWVMEGPNALSAALADAAYRAYSPGLELVAFPYGGSLMSPKELTMTFSTRDPQTRLSQLASSTDPGCWGAKLSDPGALFVPYVRALLEEAQAINSGSPRSRGDVEHIQAVLRRATEPSGPKTVRVVPLQGGIDAASPASANNPARR